MNTNLLPDFTMTREARAALMGFPSLFASDERESDVARLMRDHNISKASAECVYSYDVVCEAFSEGRDCEACEAEYNAAQPRTAPRNSTRHGGRRESFKVFALLSLGCAVLLAFELSRHAWAGNGGAHALAAGAVLTGLWAVVNWRAR